ncbi:hypothetical protein CAPTEDRAFT_91793 [Capitella teleta]|uniref:EF-hand domain-containing protein n=1 Tax=Capitella teleta TaxID=283909 RepID=R7U6P0_CAPTE|nr:hypothetical protein CAPTEDRAFT_91793 [Capitella teleta]|eukprot:ELU02025.1 hypothetical protein CAPTEDRAFT_91793 [Capitella teleta]
MSAAATPMSPEQIRAYREHFEQFDLNGDGVISTRELSKVSQKLGYRLSNEQITEIMKANDLDCNGCLSFDEFLRAMPANTITIPEDEHRASQIQAIFKEFDKDDSGAVSMDEAKLMLEKIGIPAEEVESLVHMYDSNKDGELQYSEFVAFLLHS